MSERTRPLSQVWGSEVVEAIYAGHPGRMMDPRPRTIGEMLIGVERWRDREHVVQGSRRITFEMLLGALEPAAAMLVAHGAEPGDHVLLHGYNSPDWILALWAIWRVGAIPVLGNRWWSGAEISHAVEISAPVLAITDVPDPAGSGLPPAVSLADLGESYREGGTDVTPAIDAFPSPDEDSPGLILFTSGSSGAPKGVVLSHRSVIANQHNLLWRSGRLPSEDQAEAEPNVALVCTPLFHIGGVANLLTNTIIGGKIVMNDGRFDPAQVLGLMQSERVQVFGGVPTMAIRLLEHPDLDRYDLSSLRSWPLGGAPVPSSLLETMKRKVPQLQRRGLGNTWGMSESGGFCTGAGNRDLAARPGTVGRPYPVVELRIGEPDAAGVGEILVRSPTVMIGYLAMDDDQTVDADGWLRTGDLGHLDADGFLYLDGRSKDIIIRGGENIACAHVEVTLAEHPDVVEAAVFGLPHRDLGEEVAAVVVYRGDDAPSERELREFLASTLAYFEIPTRWWIRTERLPTLAGEKPDKKSLRALFPDIAVPQKG